MHPSSPFSSWCKRQFRMITLKQILSQICPGDWFFSLHLKDACNHIQIAPHHSRFMRFAFGGVAYQYMVLPFGLSLAPHTFTKCMDAALSPLPQQLAHFSPVRERASIPQIQAPQPLRVSRTQGQFCQECAVPQPMNFVPGNSYRLSPNEGGSHARICTCHSAACGFIQTPLPSQSVSKDAGPHGLSTSVGPVSHAAPSLLAETSSSSTHLASRTPQCQGEPGLCCSSGPLEIPSVD